MKAHLQILALTTILIAGCNDAQQSPENAPLQFDLINTQNVKIGDLYLTSLDNDSVQVRVEAVSISPGAHGIHLHENGSCETPDFKSAGGHINPMQKAHGLDNPDGPDNADMPNAIADADGMVKFEYINERVSFVGTVGKPALFDESGSALVIHADPDDGVSQPIGGAGPRIACAVIR